MVVSSLAGGEPQELVAELRRTTHSPLSHASTGSLSRLHRGVAAGVTPPHHRPSQHTQRHLGRLGRPRPARRLAFRSGDREVVLGPGGYITKPRGELHSMWNAGDVPARMIEVISPGGFEHFFREMTELVAAGPPLFADVVELGAKYGLEFGEPEWLPDVIGRYGLTPPPRRDS